MTDRFTPDPEIAVFLRRIAAAWAEHPPIADLPIDEARAVAEAVRAPWREGGPVMVETREVDAGLEEGPMRVRLLRPAGLAEGPAPALIYLHGGGFVFFSIDTHDRLCREYAAAAGVVVLAVDYPLSPEHRYPVALDRIVALIRWLMVHGSTWGVDATRLLIGGDSAGANLALATALRLRDANEAERLRGLLLNYGAFAADVSDRSEALYGGPSSNLTRDEMAFYFDQYLPDGHVVHDPYATPLHARDLSRLPPIFLAIAEADVLREQSEFIAKRALAIGGAVFHRVYTGTTHSFLEAMSIARVARRAISEASIWLRKRCQDEPGVS